MQELGEHEGTVLSVCICLPLCAYDSMDSWLAFTWRAVGWHREGVLSNGDRGEPSSAIEGPIPPPFAGASCQYCRGRVDPSTLWSLNRTWPPVGELCPWCFGPTEVPTARVSNQP